MTGTDWQPLTDKAMLQARATLLDTVRSFFNTRGVLEVDTPILSSASGTDPALDPLSTTLANSANPAQQFFLQTSPEFAMKRLLAAGSGPIFQLAKSFRNGEAGQYHNPEFTMLEWYRPGFSLTELMDEVEALVASVMTTAPAERVGYSELFQRYLSVDPFTASLDELQSLAREKLDVIMDSNNPDHWLDLLFSHCIAPQLQSPTCITDYPPSQAALARIVEDKIGRKIALRFELVIAGVEIANGYQELTDPLEQRQRFTQDLETRKAEGLPELPVDERLLAAMARGLPDCAGVALGIDRLLMLATGANSIRDVISFPVDSA